MLKNESKRESNQALLARVTKEMDEPRMGASTREEFDDQRQHGPVLEELP
jgi:hypothetical protein